MSLVSIAIGVLDIQGSVAEHFAALKKIGVEPVAVKTKKDLDRVDGLIIPGGESTTIGKLLKRCGLGEAIRKRIRNSNTQPLTVWGTCAGAILLAKHVSRRKPDILSLMDIKIERNAYGRQIESFETTISAPKLGKRKISAVFIRAPRVKRASLKVKVLAEYGGEPVMVRQENLLATMFHPELTEDTRVHQYFVSMTNQYANGKSKN